MKERCWRIHGVEVRLQSELGIPPVLDYGLRHHCKETPGSEPEITIRVRRAEAPPPPAAGTPVAFHRPLPVRGLVNVDGFWLQAGGGCVFGNLATGVIDVAAPDEGWLNQATVVRTLLPLSLMMALARHRLFYVHAAVLVDPSGRGWMLIGGGDVGKSTTTYRLLQRGWSYLSDDGALVRNTGGRVEALSFWDELQLDRALQARLDGVLWEQQPAGQEQKGVVATDRLFPEQRCERTGIDRLLILSRTASLPAAQPPLTGPEALAALIDDNPLLLVDSTVPNFDVFSLLLGQCQLGRVTVGDALFADPESVLRRARQ